MLIRHLNPASVVRTLICVDEIKQGDYEGRVYNPYMKSPFNFIGIYSMIKVLDKFYNEIGFPQAFFSFRTFSGRKNASTKLVYSNTEKEIVKYMDDNLFETESGRKATFIIQVQFRQNATWQGTISWAEKKLTQNFRSTLELIKLMDDALSDSTRTATIFWDHKNISEEDPALN